MDIYVLKEGKQHGPVAETKIPKGINVDRVVILLVFILSMWSTGASAQQTAQEWQAAATKEYPQLAVKDSPFNRIYVAAYTALKNQSSKTLNLPEIYYLLAIATAQVVPDSNASTATDFSALGGTVAKQIPELQALIAKIDNGSFITTAEVKQVDSEGVLASTYTTNSIVHEEDQVEQGQTTFGPGMITHHIKRTVEVQKTPVSSSVFIAGIRNVALNQEWTGRIWPAGTIDFHPAAGEVKREERWAISRGDAIKLSLSENVKSNTNVAVDERAVAARGNQKQSSDTKETAAAKISAPRINLPATGSDNSPPNKSTSNQSKVGRLPFDVDKAKANLAALRFSMDPSGTCATNTDGNVMVYFDIVEGNLVSLELVRNIRIAPGLMDEFQKSSQDLADAASGVAGVFLPKAVWSDIATWHYAPISTNEWYEHKNIICRSRTETTFDLQSNWMHYAVGGDEWAQEVLMFSLTGNKDESNFPVRDAAIKLAKVVNILEKRGNNSKPTGSMSWLSDNGSDAYTVTEGSSKLYVSLVVAEGGKWTVLMPIPEEASLSGWRPIWKEVVKDITDADAESVAKFMSYLEKPMVRSGWYFSDVSHENIECFGFCPPQFVADKSNLH